MAPLMLVGLHNQPPPLSMICLFINSELASVKAHDREVTQQARHAQDEVHVIWSLSYFLVKLWSIKHCFFCNSFKYTPNSFQRNHLKATQKIALVFLLKMLRVF